MILCKIARPVVSRISSPAPITPKRAVRVQAEEEKRKLAEFPEENPNPVMRIAEDGTIIYANRSSEFLLEQWECGKGEACDLATNRCLPRQSGVVPSLEVRPPSQNNQGWEVQEFPKPLMTPDGRVMLKLQQTVSVKGRVHASHDPTLAIPAQIVAWRDSLIQGRPKVQVETSAQTGKRDGQSDNYVLWLNRGFSYTFSVTAPAVGRRKAMRVDGLNGLG